MLPFWQDTGPGIAENTLRTLFTPYVQVRALMCVLFKHNFAGRAWIDPTVRWNWAWPGYLQGNRQRYGRHRVGIKQGLYRVVIADWEALSLDPIEVADR